MDSRKIFGGPEKNEHSFRAQKYFFWEFPSEADRKIDFVEIWKSLAWGPSFMKNELNLYAWDIVLVNKVRTMVNFVKTDINSYVWGPILVKKVRTMLSFMKK